MATEVLQLGIDSTGALAGARQFERATTSVQQAATKADAATGKMEGSFNKLRSSAMSLTRVLGTLGVTIGAGALVRGIARATADMDTLRLSLDAVTGSSAETARQLKELREVAKLPGLGFKEAVQGAVNLEVVGFNAKATVRILKDFGNAVALTGGGKNELDRVIFQFTQMSSLGKVTSQDLKPILQTAPAVAKAMLAAFGTISPEKIEAMGLTFDQFTQKLLVSLETLPQATGGVKNSFENLSDAAFQASAAFGTQFASAVGGTINALAGALQSFADNRQEVARLALGVKSLATALAVGGLVTATYFAADAFGSFLVAAVKAAKGITTLRAAVMGLEGALGPVGWFIIGVSAVATYLYATRKAATDAASGMDAYAASLGNLNRAQLLVEQSDLDKRTRAVQHQIANTPAQTAQKVLSPYGSPAGVYMADNPAYTQLQTALADLESQSKRVHDALGMVFDPPKNTTTTVTDALAKEKTAVGTLIDLYEELTKRKQDTTRVSAAGETLAASLFGRANAAAPGSQARADLMKLESQLADGLHIPLQIDLPESRVKELQRQLDSKGGLTITARLALSDGRPFVAVPNLKTTTGNGQLYADQAARVKEITDAARARTFGGNFHDAFMGSEGGTLRGAIGKSLGAGLAQFGPLAAAAAALSPVFQGLKDAIAPVLAKLAHPLEVMGRILGDVITPVLEMLQAPLEAVATLFSVLAQPLKLSAEIIKAYVAPGLNLLGKVLKAITGGLSYIVEGIGYVVKGIGELVDKLVPDIISHAGKGLAKTGQDIIDGAERARHGFDAVASASDKLAASLSTDLPRAINLALYRARIGAPGGGGTVGGGAVGGGGPVAGGPIGGGYHPPVYTPGNHPVPAGGVVMNFAPGSVVNEAGDDEVTLARKMAKGAQILASQGVRLHAPALVVAA